MEQITEWKDIVTETLGSVIRDIASILPNVIGALVILFFGWLIHKVIRFMLKKLLKLANIDGLSKKIEEAQLFGDSQVKIDVSKILLGFVKGLLLLVFIIAAADTLKLHIISSEIANLLRYLPILLSALVIFMVGMFAAQMIKKALSGVFKSMGFSGGKLVSSIIFYLLVIFVTITALNQAGIDTAIITNNFTLVLGAFLLAFSIAFGLGSKEMLSNLLATFYARKNFAIGDTIELNGTKGTITAIDTIFVVLATENGKLVVPIKEIVENRVKVG